MKKLIKVIPIVAALIAIILAVADIVSLKKENSFLRNELQSINEKNKLLFSLLVKLVSNGNVTLGEIAPFVSNVEAKEISNRVAEVIKISLPFDLETMFYPSGWMGDGKSGERYISFSRASSTLGTNNVIAIQLEYRQGPEKWAGIYWQYPDKNWGSSPGRNLSGAHAISFYAKGERGGEIVEFKSGGISGGQYRDSYEKSLGKIRLSKEWTKYVIDLSGEDLSNVIGAFAWIVAGSDNNGNTITYIANISVE